MNHLKTTITAVLKLAVIVVTNIGIIFNKKRLSSIICTLFLSRQQPLPTPPGLLSFYRLRNTYPTPWL